jgi:hypothetical protein
MAMFRGRGTKIEALLNQNIQPVNFMLTLAACIDYMPKIKELLRAGSKYEVKDVDQRKMLE